MNCCSRCGYCCIMYSVILPDGSEKVEPSKCKFLKWENSIAVCLIHGKNSTISYDGEEYHYTWEETPCGRHGEGLECRLGKYVTQNSELKEKLKNFH